MEELKEGKDLLLHQSKAESRVQNLPASLKEPLSVLLSLQNTRNSHYISFVKDLKSLEQSFESQYDSLYSQRAEILKTKRGFWLKVLQNNSLCSSLIYESDHEALEYLVDIKCIKDPDSCNFAIEFFFDENPFFENNVLRKKYVMTNEDVMEKGVGTHILWKGERKDASGSFFKYFKDINMPSPAELEGLSSDEEEELVENVEQDYDIGNELKEEIVPNAILHYFTSCDSDKD